ncbi:vicilin-like seed storage protein At2g18540 isoform X1 [Triticum urartu]|uniref:Uncharacterized protein n=2 Tax=Triticum urartu TaxID=4572 RepID=A0A8R7UHX7_TRIUA|nr:vicilin-like seed storage protein At2g18540 isoform X1 [Triticum urartu]XP_048531220.1 vicilin-like seed storage protein At2g18540 isoform X1 [Triticum urartu]
MAGPMHQRQVANATTAVSRHNAIDAGPPGFGRSTATSVGVQQTEGDENEMGNILQEITEMQATAVDGGRRHVISSCKNITIGMECARARNVTVKHENDEDSCRQPRVLDIDGECARQLQKELDEEYVIEEASRQANRLKSMITPGVVVCVVDTDSSKDAEFEERSDHENDWLVEIDRRLKEQEDKDAELAKKRQEEAERESKEQQAKDEELASKCQQEIEQKAMEQLANDDQVACMYQKMYDQNATDEQIKVATTHHGQGTGAGGHRASDVGVQTRLDNFFHCRTGLADNEPLKDGDVSFGRNVSAARNQERGGLNNEVLKYCSDDLSNRKL